MTDHPKTLIELAGGQARPAPLAQSVLVLIDAQQEYFAPSGKVVLPGGPAATKKIAEALDSLGAGPEDLALTQGGIVSEAVMYGLGWKMGRGEAHEITIKMAREAHAQHGYSEVHGSPVSVLRIKLHNRVQ